MNALKLYKSGRVERFHTLADFSGARRQNLAEHQWGVALFVLLICEKEDVFPSPRLLQAALLHDAEESIVGDVPAPAKWRFNRLHTALADAEESARDDLGLPFDGLSEQELQILKWADCLELLAYTRQRFGENSYREVFYNIRRYMTDELPAIRAGESLMNLFSMGESV